METKNALINCIESVKTFCEHALGFAKTSIKKFVAEEMKKLATGEAAVPTKKMILALRNERKSPNDAAKMLLSQEMRLADTSFPHSVFEKKLREYEAFFNAAYDAVERKGEKILTIPNGKEKESMRIIQ
jgi:hypothetical protein